MTIDRIDRVIHEPARFLLMAHLSIVDETDSVHLVRQSGFSTGNAGSHLKKQRDAGYVSVTKAFVGNRPRTMCSITEKGTIAPAAYRQTIRHLLDAPGD